MGKRLIPYEALRGKGILYSKPHLWRLEKQKKFPRRIYTNPGGDGGGRSSYAYDEDEIDAHIESLIAARDANITTRDSDAADGDDASKETVEAASGNNPEKPKRHSSAMTPGRRTTGGRK